MVLLHSQHFNIYEYVKLPGHNKSSVNAIAI